jgi:hypothetical protein
MTNKEPIVLHDFILGPCDTDSISFCKPDFSPFSEEEQQFLIDEINAQMPEFIRYAHDGYFKSAVVLKAKNYILKDYKNKIKMKGSALKASQKEPFLKEFIDGFTKLLLDEEYDKLLPLYNQYVQEILNVKDIKRFSSKKTVTDKVLNPEHTTQQNILDAIQGLNLALGDKVYVYFNKEGKLKEVSRWQNDHDIPKLLERLYKTAVIFENVIDLSQFKNFKLKKNQKELGI